MSGHLRPLPSYLVELEEKLGGLPPQMRPLMATAFCAGVVAMMDVLQQRFLLGADVTQAMEVTVAQATVMAAETARKARR